MAATIARQLVQQHPLQRLRSPSRSASAMLHALGLASFSYSYSYFFIHPNPVIKDSYGWHLQYLTIIGLSMATLTFLVGFLADLTLSHSLFQLKNVLSVASAPMECLISLLYWGLRAVDPKLVQPSWSPVLPLKTDISLHAMPSLFLTTDLFFFSPPYTIAFLPALALSGCIAFGYWFWIERCYRFNRFYPYPIFQMLNTPQRIGLFAISALLMTFSTSVLIYMYGLVNGKEVKTAKDLRNGSATKHVNSANIKGQ